MLADINRQHFSYMYYKLWVRDCCATTSGVVVQLHLEWLGWLKGGKVIFILDNQRFLGKKKRKADTTMYSSDAQ